MRYVRGEKCAQFAQIASSFQTIILIQTFKGAMSDSRWYFTEEQLANSPSRKCGINAEQELSYRQRAANLVQEMGQRLQVYVLFEILS
jgi:hypothetical protein